MTKKIVLRTICQNGIWKETAKYLKHYRMKSKGDLDIYNLYLSALMNIRRKTEAHIYCGGQITRLEYRKKIIEMEKQIKKKLAEEK